MSSKGYKLVAVDKLSYTFEEATPNEYIYDVEFIAHKSNKDAIEYTEKLKKKGYNVFFKNINISCSVFKSRYRFYGKGAGKIVTNPGSFNKKLLIISKQNDGILFDSLSKNEDVLAYYRTLRDAWILYPLAGIILSIIGFVENNTIMGVICAIATFFMTIVVLNYQYQINEMKKNRISTYNLVIMDNSYDFWFRLVA